MVFVYGTLRQGCWNHHLLMGSYLVGKGRTSRRFGLYVDKIPFVYKEEAISHITGELYEVDDETLGRIDRLEGHPQWYRREQEDIQLTDGITEHAWVYFFPEKSGKLIPSGDYMHCLQ
jgi:gamma-glutamylcyclotransferase (GGCT)/AIG2-like uncharacterized protein YtfP